MKKYYLGIDIGGTKSHALVTDETGQALGIGEAGPGNHEVVGYPGLISTLQEITQQALERARVPKEQIAGAGFGVAGYDWPSERAPTLEAIGTLGLQAPVEAVNDTIVGLLAGASEGWGVVVVAGTSNNCRGRDRQGREGRVTGNGPRFGEYGGAYELVHRAIQAVAYEWTQRGPSTRLTQAFIELVGAGDITDLLEGLALDYYYIGAQAAPLIFEVAIRGDQVAREVIAWAGRELAGLANGVIQQLSFEKLAFEVVLTGSLYNGGPLLIDPMRTAIQALAPGATLVRLTVPPVVGGVLLGMEIAGLNPYPLRERLVESTRQLMETGG